MKRDHPKTQIRLMPLVCADCLSVCFLFFFFFINDITRSPWLDPGLWSPSLSLLLSCSAVGISRVNQVPTLARTVLCWAFLSVLFAVGRGQVLFLGLSFPVLQTPAHHQLQSRWPCFCPERALGVMFRNPGSLKGDLEAAVSMYS